MTLEPKSLDQAYDMGFSDAMYASEPVAAENIRLACDVKALREALGLQCNAVAAAKAKQAALRTERNWLLIIAAITFLLAIPEIWRHWLQ